MKKFFLLFFCLITLSVQSLFSQGPKTFITGSYIVNMGLHTGTKSTDVRQELVPWGMVYDLLKNYNVPIYVVIDPSKTKDGNDFVYNGVNYRGGTFVIDKKNISTAVATRIAYWNTRGVVGNYTISNLTLNTTFRYTVVPVWVLDTDNGPKLSAPFFTNAEIPSSAFSYTLPAALGACHDIFVLPHADPKWSTHGNLLNWNSQFKGAIWMGCHGGSALHNTYNPANISQQMNFLTTKTNTAGSGIILPASGSANYSNNSLQLWDGSGIASHTDATPPYNTCTGSVASGTLASPSDPVAQYIGVTDAVHQNGSEQNYIPAKGQTWLSSTKIICYDPSSPNVPGVSNGPDVLVAYGRAFGDINRGLVMLEGGHDFNKGSAGDVAAQRAFWNWSFLAAQDKAITISGVSGLATNGIVTSGSNNNFTVNYSAANSANPNLTFSWTCVQTNNGQNFGSFSPANAASTLFTPAVVSSPVDVVLQIVITDACGRQSFESYPLTIVPSKIQISGRVWQDLDSTANNTFNNIVTGNEQGTNAFGTLYIYGLDKDGFVLSKSKVNNDGSYMMSDIPGFTNNLSIILSNDSISIIGSYQPLASLPLNWRNTTPLTRNNISTLGSNLGNIDWGVYQITLGGVVPVTLKHFDAIIKNGEVLLIWETADEINNRGFEIQRRLQGSANYEKIGFVDAKAVSGLGASYLFTDPNAHNKGTISYRLAQIDHDGKKTYSDIRVVNAGAGKSKLTVYPNPSNGSARVSLPVQTGKADISLEDFSGKTIQRWTGYASSTLQLDQLRPGIYIIRVKVQDTGEQITDRLIVQ